MNSNSKNKNPIMDKDLFKKRLIELRGERSRHSVAKDLFLKDQTLEKYEKGYTLPNIEKAAEIAQYFGVSTDFLLGLSDVQSFDTDIQAICKYTGLSEKALRNIKGFDRYYDINQIFEDYTFFKFMICTYENFKKHYKPINKRNNDDA